MPAFFFFARVHNTMMEGNEIEEGRHKTGEKN